jgi:Acetyltransferase (GNAT) domain
MRSRAMMRRLGAQLFRWPIWRPRGATARAGRVAPGSVEICSRRDLAKIAHWPRAFAAQRKDHRYYEVVEDTLHQGFEHGYFVTRDALGEVRAVQPFFVLDQDLLAGTSPRVRGMIELMRRLWPRFMQMRTLMVGCAAGEGHIDGSDEWRRHEHARLLVAAIRRHARTLKAKLIVLKEFPARYRAALECFRAADFTRIPSLPMVRLDLGYASFEEYMDKALSGDMRRKLRKKFKIAAQAPAIEISLVENIGAIIDEVYPLYQQVYERSQYQFEKLTPDYFIALEQRMPDKVRYFVWRQEGRIIGFAMCMVHEDSISFEYLGLDYRVALDLHLYHHVMRDLFTWAIANGCRRVSSTAVKYDPKFRFRFTLDPLDLYVRHTSDVVNAVMKRLLPWMEPTRHDPILRKFPNYAELWGAEESRGLAAPALARLKDLLPGLR